MTVKMSKNDILLYKESNSRLPVIDVNNELGIFWVNFNGRIVKRSFYQLIKMQNRYILIKCGDKIKKDVVFYDPETNKIITLNKGTIYLGEL